MSSSPLPAVLKRVAPLAVLCLGACAALPVAGKSVPMLAAPPLAAERTLAGQGAHANVAKWPAEDWWHALGDPQLAALVDEGLAGSPSVAMAAARYRNALGMAGQARGDTLPSLDVGAKAGYSAQSYNIGYPKEFLSLARLHGLRANGELTGRLSFDPDLWGRNRAALAAATSEARAAALDLAEARLMLASGIASAYVDLARLEAEADLHRSLFEAAQAAQALMAQRLANGLENRGGLRLADANAAAASAELAAANQAIAVRRHQLAALLGAGPDRGLAITRPRLPTTLVAGLPAGITTELVGRRPDIAAARARAEAAALRVKVARADFFPAINLGALVGVQSLGLANLVTGDSVFGNAGPAITLPLFRGGEIKGRYHSAKAGHEAALAQYDEAVVAAYQQVADAVTSRAALEQQLADSHRALAAAQEVLDITVLRYQGGLTTRLDALAREQELLQARIKSAELVTAVRSADIALIVALGGGFGAVVETASDTPMAASAAPLSASKEIPHG